MNSRLTKLLVDAKLRFLDDIVVPKAGGDAPKKIVTNEPPEFMKSFTPIHALRGTQARKDPNGYLFTNHFIDQAIDRGLTQNEFNHIYNIIKNTESSWKQRAKSDNQRYMFTSKSRNRSFIVWLLNGKISVITCLPKGRHSNDDTPDTIKIIIESKMVEAIQINIE
jgi:hypothetical protein